MILIIIANMVIDLAIIAGAFLASYFSKNWNWMWLCLLILASGMSAKAKEDKKEK